MGEGEGGMFWENSIGKVYYQGWKRSPSQVGCMRQVLGAGALGRPRGMGWRGRWEGGLGWGTHVNPWLIHVNVWQKPQYCKVISLQLIKKNRFRCYSEEQWHETRLEKDKEVTLFKAYGPCWQIWMLHFQIKIEDLKQDIYMIQTLCWLMWRIER